MVCLPISPPGLILGLQRKLALTNYSNVFCFSFTQTNFILMILLCDSGSTKADWAVMSSNGSLTDQIETPGLNPLFQTEKEMVNILLQTPSLLHFKNKVAQVFFYGVGCGDANRKLTVQNALEDFFGNAQIQVDTDLMGAVKAVYDGKPCSVSILGTGSNSCHFNGTEIVQQIGGLGFILGDEAGGAYYGKKLLSAFLLQEFEGPLYEHMFRQLKLSKAEIIDAVYRKFQPNVYLAGFAKLLVQFKEDPYAKRLVQYGFEEFITKHLLRYHGAASLPAHFIGSIAYHHKDTLLTACSLYGIKVGKVIPRPIEGLSNYHR